MTKMNWRDYSTLIVLCGFTLFFTLMVLLVDWFRPDDGQVYSVFTGLLTGFAGALMMHLKGEKITPPGTTTVTQIDQVTKTPVEPTDLPKGGTV